MLERNSFSTAAMLFGAFSLLTLVSAIGITGIFFGALAILFAILSKKGNLKMNRKSLTGFAAGLTGLLASIYMTINSVYMYFHNPEFKAEMDSAFVEVYGVTCEEFFVDLTNFYITGDPGKTFGGE